MSFFQIQLIVRAILQYFIQKSYYACCSFIKSYSQYTSSVGKHPTLGPENNLLTNLWEASIRVLPLSRTCVKLFHSWRLAIGSTPVVGSSRKIIEGLPISATPTFNLRWLPPLNEIIKQSTSTGWRTNFGDDKSWAEQCGNGDWACKWERANFYLPPTESTPFNRSPKHLWQPQSITVLWPVLISRPAEGRRLSWPWWLDAYYRWE